MPVFLFHIMTTTIRLALLATCLLLGKDLFAAPPEIDPAKDLPRFPAVEPKDAIGTMQLKKGFHLEIAAAEPLVQSPVAMCFDENGRLFVCEMIDYSERRDERLGTIVMLEDTNGDGVYDKSTVFAKGFPWPTALFWAKGGLFLAATPDIYFLKDTDRDGKADDTKLVYTGFANTQKRVNMQGLLNTFIWGLDNRIHGTSSTAGGIVSNLVMTAQKPLDLNGRDFAINPLNFEMTSENGGGQHGLSFDTWGRRYATSNSRHIMSYIYDAKYAGRNPHFAMPGALIDIPVDGPAAEVYRLSPEEPWRVIRTKWRVSGVASGPIEGGGRASGYFTGATGVTIYKGDAFPEEFLNNAFIGDAGGNLVHRKLIVPNDVGVKAVRPDDEQKVEFLASKDTWFRPVQFANGPDGAFYVIDMHREVIEHPWSLPEQLKKHIDLNSGNDRGRIFRIVPDAFNRRATPQLGKMSSAELVRFLEHPNGWHRETASRLLFERQDKSVVAALHEMVQKSHSVFGRLHALWMLDGLDSLTEKDVLAGLNDSEAHIREHSVKLSEKLLSNGKPSEALWSKLQTMAGDSSINVVYQLAFTLGEIKNGDRTKILAQCVSRDLQSDWMRAAVLSSLAEGAGDMFAIVSRDSNVTGDAHGKDLLEELAKLIGADNKTTEVASVLEFLRSSNDLTLGFSLVRALGDGLKQAGSSLAKVDKTGSTKNLITKAAQLASDESAKENDRIEAIHLLGLTTFQASGESLLNLLNLKQPQSIQLAAIATLGKFNDPKVGPELAERVSGFTPRVRAEAIDTMLARADRALALLNAIDQKKLRVMDLTTAQTKFLRTHRDKAVHAAAEKILGKSATGQRQDVVDAYSSALTLKGDSSHGREIYLQRCSSCHRLGGAGSQLGPDLVTVKNTGKDKMLLNILDPNREVAPQFQAFEVELKDGDSLIGLVANETATSVTVRQAYGKEDVVLRSSIKQLKNQNQSLMPEGLEAGLKPQDFADLLEYISAADAK